MVHEVNVSALRINLREEGQKFLQILLQDKGGVEGGSVVHLDRRQALGVALINGANVEGLIEAQAIGQRITPYLVIQSRFLKKRYEFFAWLEG